MKSRFVLSLMLAATAQVAVATVPLYEINSPINSPPDVLPQIDATAVSVNNSFFASSGVILISGGSTVTTVVGNTIPFDTTNTRFFTNNSTMFSDVGFRFDLVSGASRSWQSNFVNRGSIEGGTYMLISATNLTSAGLLAAGGNGLLQLNGRNVNLTGSGLRTGATTNLATVSSVPAAIYWASGTNNNLGQGRPSPLPISSGIFNLPFPTSTSHQVNQFGAIGSTVIPSLNFQVPYTAYAYSDIGINQVVFVPADLSAQNVQIRVLFGSPDPDTGGRTAVVEFRQPQFDSVTETYSTNLLYFSDAAATFTNRLQLVNQGAGAFIPTNYTLSSFAPADWTVGVPGNVPYTPSLLWDSTLAFTRVTNGYTAYGAVFGSLASSFSSTGVPIITEPSNLLGRIEINAETLNLRNSRIRAESFVSIKATSLVSNQFSSVESPIVSYDIAATNSFLTLSNLYAPIVTRYGGEILAWTGIWQNETGTNANTGTTTTNTYHVLILDPYFTGLTATTLYDLSAKATNLVIVDQLSPAHNVKLDAESLTVNASGGIFFGSTTTNNVTSNNIPRLKYLTNDGLIYVPGTASFSSDRPQRMSNVVNRGSLYASTLSFKTRDLVDLGFIQSFSGVLTMDTLSAAFTNDFVSAGSDLRITGRDLMARGSQFTAGSAQAGQLRLTVTNLLTDGGADANNFWTCSGGMSLNLRPTNSSLLGTTIRSTASQFQYPVHTWAATNRGATASGYTSNAAIGRLVLDSSSTLSGFGFSGVGTNNAIYVDFLEFQNQATNYQSILSFNSNIILYFADSNLPAGKLDGAYGGHLRWVKNFAGPNSSTNVPAQGGGFISANRQLVMSPDIDSDADGIPNNIDAFPFDGVVLSNVVVTNGPPKRATITWLSAADTVYTVEFKTNLSSLTWNVLTNLTTGATSGPVSVQDPSATPVSKFYRVRYTP